MGIQLDQAGVFQARLCGSFLGHAKHPLGNIDADDLSMQANFRREIRKILRRCRRQDQEQLPSATPAASNPRRACEKTCKPAKNGS